MTNDSLSPVQVPAAMRFGFVGVGALYEVDTLSVAIYLNYCIGYATFIALVSGGGSEVEGLGG